MAIDNHIGCVRFVSRTSEIIFQAPVDIVCARTHAEVRPALARIEAAVATGLHAAGFLSYESAPAFDDAFQTHSPGDIPLLWFGLYASKEEYPRSIDNAPPVCVGAWETLVSEDEYHTAIARIHEHIAAGDTYQVNYTFPMRAAFQGDPEAWFHQLCQAQRADHCAYIHTSRFSILSASPELFFRLSGEQLAVRPMKGTRPRGPWHEKDRLMADELIHSSKEQAENVMIVDLLRNDLGRIAAVDSVKVSRLFDVERYDTVWQMTSTIQAATGASVPEILAALFPSGSVTGAPKVRTMQLIQELEPFPRGVYCGSIGWWSPGRQAEFNVAIRTVTVDRERNEAVYNVGGGITWGSTASGEYAECRVKAALLTTDVPSFELLESLLWDGDYFLLNAHLERLQSSATYFDFALDGAAIQQALQNHAAHLQPRNVAAKVRLLVNRQGDITLEDAPLQPLSPIRLGFATEPMDTRTPFLYHKTTHRAVYEQAKAQRPDCEDVLLWNEDGEITESTFANVVLDIDGESLTPPVAAGLLSGTMRAHLLASGEITEGTLTKADVRRAHRIRLINSVRRWLDVEWVECDQD